MYFAPQACALITFPLSKESLCFFKLWVWVRLALRQVSRILRRCKALPHYSLHGADDSYSPGLAPNLTAQTRLKERAWPTPAAILSCLADVGEAWEEERHHITQHPFHSEIRLQDPMPNEAVDNASCIWGHCNENCTEQWASGATEVFCLPQTSWEVFWTYFLKCN